MGDASKKESIREYAERFSAYINTAEPFALIGLSFGGVMAIEMHRFLPPHKTIIISSITKGSHLPWYFRIDRYINLHKLIPGFVFRRPNRFYYWFFSITTPEEKKLFRQILKDAHPRVLKWSMHQIVNWNNEIVPDHIVHIHGSDDRVLPLRWTKPHYIIKGGGHFMVYSKADEVSVLLGRLI